MMEAVRVLSSAKHEIQGLRRQNEILHAQMGVVEVFAAALGLKHREQGQCVDVVWEIDRVIEEIGAEAEARVARDE